FPRVITSPSYLLLNERYEEDNEEDPEEGNDEEEEMEVDDEEDPEEGDDEDEEMEVDDKENNSDVSDPDEPPPPVFQFGQNFHVGESSSTRTLLNDNSQLFPPGPRPSDLRAIHSRTTKLEKQMFERYTTEFKIRNKFKENDLCMNSQEIKASTNYSDMMRLIDGLSKQVEELMLQCSRGKRLSQWEAQVRPHIPERLRFREEPPIPFASVPRADDPYVMIRDDAMAAQEDDDDDADTAKDSQPSEYRGSPRDPYKEEHEEHLKIILGLLKKEKLYAKFSKCDFWLDSVQFLGHVVNSEGVHVDPSKIKAIKNWNAPTTPTEYEWGEDEEEAFQILKQKLCSVPILALPEGSEDFVVYCDASIKGYGAVLMQ
ncbi:putative reverse transcriptase domain-containing protein, partial [Tanacetum coccineum]